MNLIAKPSRRHRHPVRLDATVTRNGGVEFRTVVTDLSLEGCCLMGRFQRGEILDLSIRRIGRFPTQVQWVKLDRAGARFVDRRATDTSPAARIRGLMEDNRGVAAIEYAFLLALIALSLLAALTKLGNGVEAQYSNISSSVENPNGTEYDNGSPA